MNQEKINNALDKVIVSASVSIVTLALANSWVYAGKPGLSLLPGQGGESDYRRAGVTDNKAEARPTNPADFAVRPSQLGEGGQLPVLVAGFGIGGGTGTGLNAGIGGNGSAPGVESGTLQGDGAAGDNGDNGNGEASGKAGSATAAVIASNAVVGAIASSSGRSTTKSAPAQRQAKTEPTKRTSNAGATTNKPRTAAKAAPQQMSTDAWCRHVLSERRNTKGCIAAGYRYTVPQAAHKPVKQAGILAANGWKQTAGQLTGSVTGSKADSSPVKQLRRDIKAEVKPRATPPKHTEKQTIAGTKDTAMPARTRREAIDTSAAEKAAANRKAAAAQSAKALQAQQEAAQRAAAAKAWKEKKAAEEQAKAKAEAEQARKAARLAYLQRKAQREAEEIKRLQARADWLKSKESKEQAEAKQAAQAAQSSEQRRLDVKFCKSLERKGQLHTARAATCRTVYGFKAPSPAPKAQARQAEKKATPAKRAHGLTKHEKDARYCESLRAPHLNRTCRIEHGYKAPKTAARKHVPVKQARPAKPKISKHDRDAAYCKTLNAPHTNRTCRIEHGYSAPKAAAKKHQPAKAAKVQRLEKKVKAQSQAQKDRAYCKTLGGNAWKNKVCRNSYGFKKPADRKKASKQPMNTKGKHKTQLWCGFDDAHNFEYKCRKDTNKDYYTWSE